MVGSYSWRKNGGICEVQHSVFIGDTYIANGEEFESQELFCILAQCKSPKLLAALGGAFFFFNATTIVDRRDYRAAVTAFESNPTHENETRLRSEARKTEILRARDAAVETTIVAAAAFGVLTIYRFVRRPKRAKSG